MKSIKRLKLTQHLINEVKQNQVISDRLIQAILYSKRLLVDHVEALEQCLIYHSPTTLAQKDEVDNKMHSHQALCPELLNMRNFCILWGTAALEHIITPRILRFTLIPSVVFASGFSALYMMKRIFGLRNQIIKTELDYLIQTIDEFSNCIRRNMTYFNEIVNMKQQELLESRQIEKAWDCITSTKEVTEILFETTRKLEKEFPLPSIYLQYYAPIEDLKDCEYFKKNVTDYLPKQIKDFYNIFAYIQSQFLLRLALTIFTQSSLSQLNREMVKVNGLIRQIINEEEQNFQNLCAELNQKKSLELYNLSENRIIKNRNNPISTLQDSSLKLNARMVAVACECHHLDIALQHLNKTECNSNDNNNYLLEVANRIRSIESTLTVCFDDFQRIILMYNKFLNSKLKSAKQFESKPDDAGFEDTEESYLRVEISSDPDIEEKDDFYAYLFDNEQQAENITEQRKQTESNSSRNMDSELEILNFEKHMNKRKFRPVLRQLKHRIDPIRRTMLEKEREVLSSKGINVDQLFGKDYGNEDQISGSVDSTDIDGVDNDDDDDGNNSDNAEFNDRSKPLKQQQDSFAEMRQFLTQKKNNNLFPLHSPNLTNILGAEDVHESECWNGIRLQ